MALPDRVFAHASPTSIGGRSLFSSGRLIYHRSVRAFRALPATVRAARVQLQNAGFEVLQATPLTINFAGPPDLFEKYFQTKIQEKEVARPDGTTTTYLDSPGTELLGLVSTASTPVSSVIEGVALEVPRTFFDPSPTPPNVDYYHLRVPADIASASKANLAHAYGITGQGVRVAFVDSGWYRHPYFQSQGYNVAPVVAAPGVTNPEHDEDGHGTAESANLLAIAPGCQLLPVKMNFVNSIAAFNAAVALQPDVISCSWGSNSPYVLSAADMALAASVAEAVSSGIVVVFSAGNGHAGFPGQHPDVISAGGTYMAQDGSLVASDYSSAFTSLIYPGRRVPDVCGLVGMRPKAIYIMLPLEPGSRLDVANQGGVFPDGDGTAPDDGWAGMSGTSAAAPQLAGAAALVKQVGRALSPAAVKYALMATGSDVTQGVSSPVGSPEGLLHNGVAAAVGPDDATGWGLFDVFSAVVAAYYLSITGTATATPAAGLPMYGYTEPTVY
jgi:subtilisin family serine protease